MNKYLITYTPLFSKGIIDELGTNNHKELTKGLLLLESIKIPQLTLAHEIYKIDATEKIDINNIIIAIKKILNKTKSFSIKCTVYGDERFNVNTLNLKSRDIEVQVGIQLEKEGFKVDRKNPNDIILINLADNTAFITKTIPDKSNFNYGDKLNRSQLKLREALSYFNIDLKDIKSALDIGASPGGFSKELSKNGIKVTAIDPAELDSSLRNDNNIVHLKIRAEEFKPMEKFDLLVNDMNLHPNDSAKILLYLSKFLKNGAFCIMTVKCPTKNVFFYIKNIKGLLEKDFKDFEFKHLPHNKMEITMKAIKI